MGLKEEGRQRYSSTMHAKPIMKLQLEDTRSFTTMGCVLSEVVVSRKPQVCHSCYCSGQCHSDSSACVPAARRAAAFVVSIAPNFPSSLLGQTLTAEVGGACTPTLPSV